MGTLQTFSFTVSSQPSGFTVNVSERVNFNSKLRKSLFSYHFGGCVPYWFNTRLFVVFAILFIYFQCKIFRKIWCFFGGCRMILLNKTVIFLFLHYLLTGILLVITLFIKFGRTCFEIHFKNLKTNFQNHCKKLETPLFICLYFIGSQQ